MLSPLGMEQCDLNGHFLFMFRNKCFCNIRTCVTLSPFRGFLLPRNYSTESSLLSTPDREKRTLPTSLMQPSVPSGPLTSCSNHRRFINYSQPKMCRPTQRSGMISYIAKTAQLSRTTDHYVTNKGEGCFICA